ncbi:hypothetical protein HanXRQr2_Chr17g0793021 [Helianthus annuus]|uniref:Uncharacterized protein n=1 Tax=Helianthus annuus TaxID=4232 RepID=A0A9K3DFT8_HELAN|nr:hypothetical protein HanXRQr2_Chr17g0793021 [Helianthus annuus]KAJ0812346.1 hypothetical protein HanPSC8_Chr17g0761011 [Helianthus annuus]
MEFIVEMSKTPSYPKYYFIALVPIESPSFCTFITNIFVSTHTHTHIYMCVCVCVLISSMATSTYPIRTCRDFHSAYIQGQEINKILQRTIQGDVEDFDDECYL